MAQKRLSYFELLLSDAAVVGVEKLKDVWNQISAAEIVGSQRSEQHILSSAAYLRGIESVKRFFYNSVLKTWIKLRKQT